MLTSLPTIDFSSPDWTSAVLAFAQQYMVAFVLVIVRLSGLLTLSPVFGHPSIPKRVRAMLVLSLAWMLAPVILGNYSQATFRRLDVDQDGLLRTEELPLSLHSVAQDMRRAARLRDDAALNLRQFKLPLPAPDTVADFVALAIGEFSIGFAMSFGVFVLLSGLQMAGHLIDNQTGLALGQIFNPAFGDSSSISSDFLTWVGTALYLAVGGHLLLISGLMDTFQTLPLGYAQLAPSTLELLGSLIHLSLVLAIQVSAPVVLSLTLVGFAMGIIGHTVTNINFIDVGVPIRVIVGLGVLALALNGLSETSSQALMNIIQQLRLSLPVST